MAGKIILYIFVVVISLIIIVFIKKIYDELSSKKYDKIVKETSPLYKNLTELNVGQKFHENIPQTYYYPVSLKSKRSFENLFLTDFLRSTLVKHEVFYDNLFAKLAENSAKWDAYRQEYEKLAAYTPTEKIEKTAFDLNTKINPKKYNDREMKLFVQHKLNKPRTRISVSCSASYTSPAGRNHYHKDAVYPHEQVYSLLLDIKEKRGQSEDFKQKAPTFGVEIIVERDTDRNKKEEKFQAAEQKEKSFSANEYGFAKTAEKPAPSETEKNSSFAGDSILSQYSELKKLKQALSDGTITFEEYSEKRKEIKEN